MDFNAIIKRVIGLVTKPKEEWQEIKKTDMTVAQMFTGYAMILAAIPAIAGFIGYSLIGISYGIGSFRYPAGRGILWAILMYIFSLAGVYLLAFIIDALAPSFGSTKNMVVSLKIVIFAYTATWVGGIFYIIPSLAILAGLISLYTLFLLYLGMEILKEVPKDKMVGYFVVTIIVSIIIYFLIGFIITRIALGAALSVPAAII
ncbi:MAG: YIP1 family protein [Candidatus Aminicenantes bacterium]|nr:YIP1 family protein [Candidatus Aminicenantes bacterium]